MEKLDGVSGIEVNLENKKVMLKIDKSITDLDLKLLIDGLGYKVIDVK